MLFDDKIVAVRNQGEVYVGLYAGSVGTTVILSNAVLLYPWQPNKSLGDTPEDAPNWLDLVTLDPESTSTLYPAVALPNPSVLARVPQDKQAGWRERLGLRKED